MKRKHRLSRNHFRKKFGYPPVKGFYNFHFRIISKRHEVGNQFLWIWRFLFTWGWNGKKNTFSVSFFKADMETEVWTIGDY